jgi:ribonuclease R
MSKKRKSFQKSKSARRQRLPRQEKKYQQASSSENLLLSLLHASATLSQAELYENLMQNGFIKKDIKAALESLLQEQLIHKDGRNRYKLHKTAALYEGLLTQNPRGFGFVKLTRQKNKSVSLTRDPFIAISHMGAAHHGDKVLIRVLRTRRDDRPEAVIVKILSQGTDKIGGIFVEEGRNRLVYPDDPRFPFTIRIDDNHTPDLQNGDAVIVRFERATRPTRFLSGSIIEVLGRPDAIDTQMQLVIEKFNLPHLFSEEVLGETERLDETCTPDSDREDLRTIPHVTIDGASAKDFDDAISVTKTRNGFQLYVSIADVSHFVKPGSAIDREAYIRGTSIYFPDRVIPMLPEKLSNNLCSLIPGEDRFTLTAILNFDRTGTLVKKDFTRSIIRSHHRFTYTTVKQILIDLDKTVRREHKPFLTQLKWAQELATALKKKRVKRGSIDFNLPEAEFILTDSGEIDSIKRTERNFAHQIVEEFMLAANEAVAGLFSDNSIPAIYRIHEPPAPTKAQEFLDFAKTLDLPLKPFENNSIWFAETLRACKGTKYEYIINNLLLRSMQQAKYSAKNVGHFGLAAADYTHFTSPIRRYPDLIVHRELLHLQARSSGQKSSNSRPPSHKESGEFLSGRERNAIMAERDMNDRLKITYMKDRIGDSFEATISGVTENGLFIVLQELSISGAISIDQLEDDYYILDDKNHRLFGEISAKTYQIGDFLRVTLTDVDIISKKLRFSIASASPNKYQ